MIIGSAGAFLGVGHLAFLQKLCRLNADDSVPFSISGSPDVDRLVKLIERTQRDKSVAMMIGEIRRGTSRNQFVAAMFLAAARMRVSPHHVFMIHASLQLSNDMDSSQQLLPLFWALDTLQYDREEGTRHPEYKIQSMSESEAIDRLHSAMERFDSEPAASALVALSRSTTPKSALSELWKYAGRDDGFIGHRAIALVNCWRVLDELGWQFAEPMIQFVIHQLNEGQNFHNQHESNWERAERGIGILPARWDATESDTIATLDLFEVLRSQDDSSACAATYAMLDTGKVTAGTIWDALYLLGADFMIRYPESENIGTTPLHTNTSVNALRFVFERCPDKKTRLYTLLAAVAWATKFYAAERVTADGKLWLRNMKITEMPVHQVGGRPEEVVAEIFAMQPKRRHDPSQKEILTGREGSREIQDRVAALAFSYASQYQDHRPYFQAARFLTSLKSTQDAHDIKFPVAIFENYRRANPKWRPHLIAASSHYMHGTQMADNPAVLLAKNMLG